jgi:GNAT superfamily N-acetyltransferase
LQIQSLTKYARYIKEKAGHELIENDFGFITYEVGKDCVHIHDLWVDPDFRVKGNGSYLVGMVIEQGKINGCKYLTASLQLNANNVTETLKAQLHYGFLVVGGNENEIKLAKEI